MESDSNYSQESGGSRKLRRNNGPIICVDDDIDQQYILHKCFERSRVSNSLLIMNNGRELINYMRGVSTSENDAPEFVLLDLNMPEETGLELLERLSEYQLLSLIPSIIVLTNSESTEDKKQALALGASDYIVKPGEISACIEFLDNLQHP